MKSPQISCPSCKGGGTITLPEPLASTFARFGSKAKLTATSVANTEREAGNLDVTTNAINNRLERLRTLGLLKRTRKGRAWMYERPNPGESTADPDPTPEEIADKAAKKAAKDATAQPASRAALIKKNVKASAKRIIADLSKKRPATKV